MRKKSEVEVRLKFSENGSRHLGAHDYNYILIPYSFAHLIFLGNRITMICLLLLLLRFGD